MLNKNYENQIKVMNMKKSISIFIVEHIYYCSLWAI